jgi:hypothetical protein
MQPKWEDATGPWLAPSCKLPEMALPPDVGRLGLPARPDTEQSELAAGPAVAAWDIASLLS